MNNEVSRQNARRLLLSHKYPLKIRPLKNILDKIGAAILIIILSPIIIIIIFALIIEKIAIRDVSWGLFYHENRVSLGKNFGLLKFRCIRRSAIRGERTRTQGYRNIKHLETDNKSITPVGRYIRKAYLDEIPQLFNIIKGDMGLVGPRPIAKKDYIDVINRGETCKMLIKPGLTGIVQINKGTDKATFLSDYEYIYKYMTYSQTRLCLFDFILILKTVSKVVKAEGY